MIEIKLSALKDSKPHELGIRFLFGGVCTVLAHLVAKRYGPGIGGLFLAFPAIFPAGACLIESHEKQRKTKAGLEGTSRGRLAAAADAAGAAIGSIGLFAFALVLWRALPQRSPYVVIPAAALVWGLVSGSIWLARKKGFPGTGKL